MNNLKVKSVRATNGQVQGYEVLCRTGTVWWEIGFFLEWKNAMDYADKTSRDLH